MTWDKSRCLSSGLQDTMRDEVVENRLGNGDMLTEMKGVARNSSRDGYYNSILITSKTHLNGRICLSIQGGNIKSNNYIFILDINVQIYSPVRRLL